MAINRAPFNALVDDDGSNTIGTPWNKAAIAGVILDPVDAALGAWAAVPFSAANFSAPAPLVWTVGAGAIVRNRYLVLNKVLYWSLYLSWYSGSNVLSGAGSNTLYLGVPPGVTLAGSQVVTIDFTAGIAGVPVGAGLTGGAGATRLEISKAAGGNFAVTDVPGMVFNIWLEVA